MIFAPSDLTACVSSTNCRNGLGRVIVGIDFGEATSGTAACAIFPADGPG